MVKVGDPYGSDDRISDYARFLSVTSPSTVKEFIKNPKKKKFAEEYYEVDEPNYENMPR